MIGQNFEPAMARGLVDAFWRARTEGGEAPIDSVVLDLAATEALAEYQYEAPRLAPGPIIRTPDRHIPVLLRVEQPILAVLDGVLKRVTSARN